MSEYPQLFNSIAKYLSLATELSGKDQYAQCAAYYCRYYWVKRAGEMCNQQASASDADTKYVILQLTLCEQIKAKAPIVSSQKGLDGMLAYISGERKSIIESEKTNRYDEIIARWNNLISVIEAAMYVMPENKGLPNVLKSSKCRLLEVMKAKRENRPIQLQPIGGSTVYSAPPIQTPPQMFLPKVTSSPSNEMFTPSPAGEQHTMPSIPPMPSYGNTPQTYDPSLFSEAPPVPPRDLKPSYDMSPPSAPTYNGPFTPSVPSYNANPSLPPMPSMDIPQMPSNNSPYNVNPSLPPMPSMDIPQMPSNRSPSYNTNPSVPPMPSYNSPQTPAYNGMPQIPPTPCFSQDNSTLHRNDLPKPAYRESDASTVSSETSRTTGYENNTSLLLGVYNEEAKKMKEDNPRLAKAIYQAMINACQKDNRFASYISQFQNEIDSIRE